MFAFVCVSLVFHVCLSRRRCCCDCACFDWLLTLLAFVSPTNPQEGATWVCRKKRRGCERISTIAWRPATGRNETQCVQIPDKCRHRHQQLARATSKQASKPASNQPTKTTDQPSDQPTSQPTNQPTRSSQPPPPPLPTDPPAGQQHLRNQPVHQTTSHPCTHPPAHPPTHQPTMQPTNHTAS